MIPNQSKFSNKFNQSANQLFRARLISCIGSAFSEFTIPLYLYSTGTHPIHIALQWALLALARVLSGYLAPHLSIWRADRTGLAVLDLMQAGVILVPALFGGHHPILTCYFATLLLALLSTLQGGYVSSFCASVSRLEKDPKPALLRINSRIETGRYAGMCIGYSLALLVSSEFGLKAAFIVDSLSYLLSAFLIFRICAEGQVSQSSSSVQPTYSILFGKHLRNLTISQMSLSFAIFLFNGSYIFHLKNNFHAFNYQIAALSISQYLAYSLGGMITGKMKNFLLAWHQLIRSGIALVFIGFATNAWIFIFMNIVLSFLLGFSQPAILALFQEPLKAEQQRGAGAARTALVSVTGALGAAFAGMLLIPLGSRTIYLLGACMALYSAVIISKFIKSFWSHKMPAYPNA
jgi:predicted MFS family arabinose efflux permease